MVTPYMPTEDIVSLYKLRDLLKHQLEYESSASKSKALSNKIIEIHSKITELRGQNGI